MRLSYEIAATGENQIRAVLRGVEREARASNQRMARDSQRTAQQTARSSAGPMFGPGRREQVAAVRQQERALIQLERTRLREALASSKLETRARLTNERELSRAKESLDKQRSRALMTLHKAEEREAKRVAATRRATAQSMGRGFATSVRSGVGGAVRAGGSVAGIAGGLAVGSALVEESAIRRRSAVLANQAGNPAIKAQLAAESTSVRGFSGSETLGAMSAFMGKTGDLDAARAAIKGIGDLALATDTDFEQMGEAAGNAFNAIASSVTDPKKRIEALQKVLAGWAGQGNIGAVELTDMAQYGGRLGGATAKFAGDPADLLLSMGAMAQASVRTGGATDAAEATTGVQRFAADLTKRPAQKALAGLGVDVFSDKTKTKLKDPAEIVADILTKTKGSLPMSEEIMNAESGKVLSGFSSVFLEAEKTKKGSGRDAVLGEFDRYKKAGLTAGQINTQASSVMEEPDQQFKEAAKQFNTAIGRDLLPALTKLVPVMTQLVPHVGQAANGLAKFASWFAENPLSGIGAIVAANVAKDMAAAGISNVLSSGVASLVSSMSAAQLGAMKLAGATAFAAAAWYAAYGQNEDLKKQTGGLGILDLTWGALTEGKGFFEQADENLNKQAKAEAAKRGFSAPGAVPLNPGTSPDSPLKLSGATHPLAAMYEMPLVAQAAGAEELKAAAAAMVGAAAATKEAAAALKSSTPAAPNRSQPIISASR